MASDELTCPNGHSWSAPEESSQDSAPTCPYCQELAVTVSAKPQKTDDLPKTDAVDVYQPSRTAALIDTPSSLGRLQPGTLFAGYEIEGRLGRGGMGVVYKARQPELNRTVALKMILAGADADSVALARFHGEAKVVAQMHHPNIVQIFEVGHDSGNPFLSLEYVAGGTLASKLRRALPTTRQAAQLMEKVARASHYAHERGVIHRDLKPANILLQHTERRLQNEAEGAMKSTFCDLQSAIPKITDFGLAKFLKASSYEKSLTRTGAVLGTPNYMAPEQAEGKNHLVGPCTDIFALGAILYEMLTGQAPFASNNIMETLHKVISAEPPPLEQLRSGIPRDLQTICMTCLQKDPAKRYPTAEMLADDLAAFLSGDAIVARPTGPWERLMRAVRRRPGFALWFGSGFVVLLAMIVGAWWFNYLTIGVVAVVSLLIGVAWSSARLKAALAELEQQQLLAERNVERMHLLLESTQRLMLAVSFEEILRLLSETTTRMANAERATIYMVDYERKELWSKVLLADNDIDEIRIPLGQGIAGAVAESGDIINLADPYKDERFNSEIDKRTGYVTRNMLTLPIISRKGRILGVFQVLNKRGGPFVKEDVEILQSLATSAALVMETGIVQI